MIGSGIYVDDVDTTVRKQAVRHVLLVSGIGILLLIFSSLIAHSITRPLHRTVASMRAIGRNDSGSVHQLTGEGSAVGKTVELVGLRQDGSEFPMKLSISAVRLQSHWAAVGFVRDITERKRAEQVIQENRIRMRALLDATSESVLLLDPAGQILAINAYAAQRFGQVPETITGKNFYALLPPELATWRVWLFMPKM